MFSSRKRAPCTCVDVHLVVEDLRLAALRRWNQVLVQNLEDVLADLAELVLDLLTVLLDELHLLLVALRLLLLFNAGNDAPGGTAGTDDVLVGYREQISLLDGQLLVCGGDVLHILDHLCHVVSFNVACSRMNKLTLITLGLLSKLREVDVILVAHLGGCVSKSFLYSRVST